MWHREGTWHLKFTYIHFWMFKTCFLWHSHASTLPNAGTHFVFRGVSMLLILTPKYKSKCLAWCRRNFTLSSFLWKQIFLVSTTAFLSAYPVFKASIPPLRRKGGWATHHIHVEAFSFGNNGSASYRAEKGVKWLVIHTLASWVYYYNIGPSDC